MYTLVFGTRSFFRAVVSSLYISPPGPFSEFECGTHMAKAPNEPFEEVAEPGRSGVSKASAWRAFAFGVVLLLASGLGIYLMAARLLDKQKWIAHTLEVKTIVAELTSNIFRLESARRGYVLVGNQIQLDKYADSAEKIASLTAMLRDLTRDNPAQQANLDTLERLNRQRGLFLDESINLLKYSRENVPRQVEITRESTQIGGNIADLLRSMQVEEGRLLALRSKSWTRIYGIMLAAIALAVMLAVVLLGLSLRDLRNELRLREAAEQSYRRLSHRLLQVQDEERRRLSRELHDSLGQSLVGLKMGLEMLRDPLAQKEKIIDESIEILDQSLAETRTMSYLLHPPLLDEAGFAVAANWLVEGFSKRSGIALESSIPAGLPRLPPEIELALFRVLQECLTNIHRHSGSATARVDLSFAGGRVVLKVWDDGKGLSSEAMMRFRTNSSLSVGLAGMRERVEELGGSLIITSDAKSTLVMAAVPLKFAPTTSDAPSSQRTLRTSAA